MQGKGSRRKKKEARIWLVNNCFPVVLQNCIAQPVKGRAVEFLPFLACLLGLETQECSGPQVGMLNVEKPSGNSRKDREFPWEFAHNIP